MPFATAKRLLLHSGLFPAHTRDSLRIRQIWYACPRADAEKRWRPLLHIFLPQGLSAGARREPCPKPEKLCRLSQNRGAINRLCYSWHAATSVAVNSLLAQKLQIKASAWLVSCSSRVAGARIAHETRRRNLRTQYWTNLNCRRLSLSLCPATASRRHISADCHTPKARWRRGRRHQSARSCL